MKILMIVFNQCGRGTYWRAMGFAQELAKRGHQLALLCTAIKARLHTTVRYVENVRQVEIPDLMPTSLRYGWDLWNILQRLDWLRSEKFDIVHSFETRPVCIWPALSAHRRGARLFFDWCDWFGKGGSVEERPGPFARAFLRPFETFFENHFRTCANGTTVINTFLFQRAVDLGVDPDTVRLIRNGSNISFHPQDQLKIRRSLGLSETDPFIGFVGGTFQRDGQFMAAAFDQVIAQDPRVKLVLVGHFNRPIEKWVQNPKAIIRSGPVNSTEVYNLLSACDVCWLPLQDSGANRGRWPFKLNDYMSVARPVLATAVGDLKEIILRYGLGIVTNVDASLFAQETLTLLHDKARARKIGENARKIAQDVFSWPKLTDELEELYNKIGINNLPLTS